jgi:hypothetical protein
MKIGREVSPKHGTMISLDDLRRALLLNALEINPHNPKPAVEQDEQPEFVLGFLTGWRNAMLRLEEVLSKDLAASNTLDLTETFDLDSM